LIPLSEPTILLVVLIYEEGGFQLITVARSLANAFAGSAPHNVPLFIASTANRCRACCSDCAVAIFRRPMINA